MNPTGMIFNRHFGMLQGAMHLGVTSAPTELRSAYRRDWMPISRRLDAVLFARDARSSGWMLPSTGTETLGLMYSIMVQKLARP